MERAAKPLMLVWYNCIMITIQIWCPYLFIILLGTSAFDLGPAGPQANFRNPKFIMWTYFKWRFYFEYVLNRQCICNVHPWPPWMNLLSEIILVRFRGIHKWCFEVCACILCLCMVNFQQYLIHRFYANHFPVVPCASLHCSWHNLLPSGSQHIHQASVLQQQALLDVWSSLSAAKFLNWYLAYLLPNK